MNNGDAEVPTIESRLRVAFSTIGTIGCVTVVTTIPSHQWSATGLAVVGALALFSGGAFVYRAASSTSFFTSLQKIIGVLAIIYGGCASVGALSGHRDPLLPLRPTLTSSAPSGNSWRALEDPLQLKNALASASAAETKALVVWTEKGCMSCDDVFKLGVLDPKINPKLQGYQLINVEIDRGKPMSYLAAEFGIAELPAATLVQADGSIPNFGHITQLSPSEIMGALESSELEDQSAN